MEDIFTISPALPCLNECWRIHEQDIQDSYWYYLDNFSGREAMAMSYVKYAHEYSEYYYNRYSRHFSDRVFYDISAAFEQMDKDQQSSNEDLYMMEELERESGYLDNYQYHHLDSNDVVKAPLWKRQVDRITDLLKKRR
jgi:hypothetical protein